MLSKSSRFFRSMGLLLCLSAVGTSSLALQPRAAAALVLAQAAPPSAVDCPAERQQYEERRLNAALEQTEQAITDGRVDQAAQLLISVFQIIQAAEDSAAKTDLLQRVVGSMGEGFSYTSVLERLVQAVPTQNPDAALAVLTPAIEATQGLSSSYSAAKTRTFVTLANYSTQLGQPGQSSQILAEALSVSDAIQGTDFKAIALSDIAAAYIRAEQAELALPVLASSLQFARTIESPNPYKRATQLERIASLYAQINQLDQALQVVRLIGMPGSPSNALLTVVDKYSEAGQLDRALEELQTIGQPERKAKALAIVAGRLTAQQPQRAAQLYTEAVATAKSASNSQWALTEVALHHAAMGGLVTTTDETIQAIGDPVVQTPALGAIALLYAKAGQEDRAEARLTQAIETLARIPEESNPNRIRQQLIDQAVQSGRYDYALKVTQTIQPGEETPFDRVDVLTTLADRAIAENRYDAALQITEQIPPSFVSWRDRLFPQIARGFAASGQLDQALAIAQQEALNPGFRPRVLAAIAAQLAQLGQPEQAAALFSQATQLANTSEDAYTKTEILGAIAQAYLDAGQTESATQILKQAIETTQSIEDVSSRSYFLGTIADQLILVNYYQAAIALAEAIPDDTERLGELNNVLEKAIAVGDLATVLDVIGRLEDPVFKTRWLVAAADRYGQLGQTAAAANALSQAFRTARTVSGDESKMVRVRGGEDPLIFDDDQDRGSFLSAIALKYAQMGQPAQAQQVAQALESPSLRQQLMQQISCYR